MWWMLLACSGAGSDAPEAPLAPTRTHALVVVIDTLRADLAEALSTPNMDALAARGQRIPHAWSSGTWTVPSVISLFTGMPVRQHGWDLSSGRLGRYPALPDTPLLAEVLREQGFSTAGFYANGYLAEELGFDRGFESWTRVGDSRMAERFSRHVADTWSQPGRHFAYLHLLGPHSPVDPSPQAAARHGFRDGKLEIGAAKRNQEPDIRARYRAGYQAAVEDADAVLGALLEALGPHRDDTLVVLTSDHGELLGEHDVCGHGWWLWQELTRVPLVVEGHPGELPERSTIAAVPDILSEGLGLSSAWPVQQGEELLVAQREGKLALSEDGRYKAIWDGRHGPELAVYDLAVGEDAAMTSPPDVAALRRAWEERVPAAAPLRLTVELEEGTLEQVKALGYVDD